MSLTRGNTTLLWVEYLIKTGKASLISLTTTTTAETFSSCGFTKPLCYVSPTPGNYVVEYCNIPICGKYTCKRWIKFKSKAKVIAIYYIFSVLQFNKLYTFFKKTVFQMSVVPLVDGWTKSVRYIIIFSIDFKLNLLLFRKTFWFFNVIMHKIIRTERIYFAYHF